MTAGIKLVFDTGELGKALREVRGVVERTNAIPIYGNVLIEAVAGEPVRVVATNTDMTAERTVSAEILSPGSFTIAAHRLTDVVSAFQTGSHTEIATEDGAAVVRSGRARIRFGTLSPGDFPRPVQPEGATTFTLTAKEMLQAIDAVRHAISTIETQYWLCGIALQLRGDRLYFIALDNRRLARQSLPAPSGADGLPDTILSAATIEMLRPVLDRHNGDVTIQIDKNKARFSAGGFTLLAKVIEGTFPDYSRVIPSAPERTVRFVRTALDGALGRMNVVSEGMDRKGRLSLRRDAAIINLVSQQHGEGAEEIPCEYDAGDIDLGFNLKYLRDAISALDTDDVEFGFSASNPIAPVLINSNAAPGLELVVTPMRA
ncbi:DNA polymerase III subunit beta [Sphingomonas immobilis]|uniref:Beta sliding clamp n=1 Tax=Sphingomonas immobilis TaxID=3063997 RepID=A0ABT8ZV01_9SPHN|nr:DNA polymerase III subunit beta [Sphingomonas sp. CA1-15]MDO7841098.1 DNA polymerase III subunit beta [Sphingomonas sp. CA1-15]